MSSLAYNTVIFDLDGTLLDTLGDLADAVNYALSEADLPEISVSTVREYIGGGVRNLMMKSVYGPEFTSHYKDIADVRDQDVVISESGVRMIPSSDGRSFALPADKEQFEGILDNFRSWYSSHSMVKTGPYEGIGRLLKELADAGCSMAVVSNKFDEAVRELCQHFFPEITVTIGMQNGFRKKPAPDMVQKACELLGDRCTRPVYVGDGETDIAAAVNSGMECISCLWGFRDESFLKECGAQCFVSAPAEIMEIVRNGMDGFRV